MPQSLKGALDSMLKNTYNSALLLQYQYNSRLCVSILLLPQTAKASYSHFTQVSVGVYVNISVDEYVTKPFGMKMNHDFETR